MEGVNGKARRRPCKPCRAVKARCVWDEEVPADAEARCRRCREKDRQCLSVDSSSGVVAGDADQGAETGRRARWACADCKRRKRACVGATPVFVALNNDRERAAAIKEGSSTGTSRNLKLDSMTACSFCRKHRLECTFPPMSLALLQALEEEWTSLKGLGSAADETPFSIFPTERSKVMEPTPKSPKKTVAKAGQKRKRTELETSEQSLLVDDPVTLSLELSATWSATDGHLVGLSGYRGNNQHFVPGDLGYPSQEGFFGQNPEILFPLNLDFGTLQNEMLAVPFSYDPAQSVPDPASFHANQTLPLFAATALGEWPPIERPLSLVGGMLPSTECILWMVNRFWDFKEQMGRTTVVHRGRFFRSCCVPGGAPPLLWIILWGVAVLFDTVPDAPWDPILGELVPTARKAIVERARLAMIAGLEAASTDLAVAQSPLATPDMVSDVAGRVIPLLQGLILGIIFSEKADGVRNMVGLTSLSIRFGMTLASSLKSWMRSISGLLVEERFPAVDQFFPDLVTVENWIAKEGISPPFPLDQSLAYTLVKQSTLAQLPLPVLDQIILLAEFATAHWYCASLDSWAADVVGSRLQMQSGYVDDLPVPFDARGFETGPDIPKILPVVPMSVLASMISTEMAAEDRRRLLTVLVSDVFRVGPHFILATISLLEHKTIELRARARALGFARLYPDAFEAQEELRSEVIHLRQVMKDLIDHMPKELVEMEAEGRLDRMRRLGRTSPLFDEVTPVFTVFLWNYDYQTTARSPPPNIEPDPEWYESTDGIEAGSYAVLGARFLDRLLDTGYDVNSFIMFRWVHTRLERMARILFLHFLHARKLSLPSLPLFERGLDSCLRWFKNINGQERFREWLSRLEQVKLEHLDQSMLMMDHDGGAQDSEWDAPVISAKDKALAKFRAAMENVDDAVLGLMEAELGRIE